MLIGVFFAACAPTRRPLPAVPRDELPDRWLAELAGEPCPPPFDARLMIRVEARGEPSVTLEGMLTARLPDTLRLSAGVGAFRPAFVLRADVDSCELLLHDESRYWITARETPEWRSLSPAAWSAALTWALCPASFFRRLELDDAGRFESGSWVATGRVRGSPWRAVARVRPADRALTALVLADDEGVLTEIRSSRISSVDGIVLPERLEILRPRDGWRFLIQRRSLNRLPDDRGIDVRLLRPPGWSAGGPDGFEPRYPEGR